MTALLSLQYLPCIEYFTCILKHKKIYLEVKENYIKQSYRNRCYIQTSQKTEALIVPVCKGNSHVNIQEIEIDYEQRWFSTHWRTIQSAYGNSPFFEHYRDLFLVVFEKKFQKLFDLNFALLTLCLDLLQIDSTLSFTTDYEKVTSSSVYDFRNKIHPKNSYKNNELLKPCIYNQVFGRNFAENLSIIDLLFCEGPNARHILLQSINWK